MIKETGGSAFPMSKVTVLAEDGTPNEYSEVGQLGMTLRDYFAAKAMRIMWDAYDKGYCGLNDKDEPNVKTIAEGAYQIADAMLAERSK